MIRGVLFDHDGTLVDSLSVVVEATNRVLAASGYATLPRDVIVRGMALATAPRMGDHARVADPVEQARLAEAFFVEARAIGASLATLYPGVADGVAALARDGVALAIVSNNDGQVIRGIARALGLDHHVGVLIGEQEMVAPKPDPSGALIAAQRLGLRIDECCFVGDSRADSGAAHAAGMRSIGVTWGIHTRAQIEDMGFDAVVDTMAELRAQVDAWRATR